MYQIKKKNLSNKIFIFSFKESFCFNPSGTSFNLKRKICFEIIILNSSQVNYSYKRFDINNWRQVIILQKLHYLIQSKWYVLFV